MPWIISNNMTKCFRQTRLFLQGLCVVLLGLDLELKGQCHEKPKFDSQ